MPSKDTSDDDVTVSIPYFGCPETLRRAVESILGQTHTRLTLVVSNDGDAPPWHLLDDVDDPRLVRFDLEANRGRYFADAVVLDATDSPYFLVQDADDWSEPHRIASLLQRLRDRHADAAVSASCWHDPARRGLPSALERARHLDRPFGPRLRHRADHHGLFRTSALRAVGGYYGGFRIGYDTLLMNFLQMTGRVAYVEEPLYHRLCRSDSLTRDAATGIRSAARREVTVRLRGMYSEALRLYHRHLRGGLGREELCVEISRISQRRVTPEDRAALHREAQRLRAVLPRQDRAFEIPSRDGLRADDPRLPWNEWSLGRASAQRMLRDLEAARPGRILEIGSGASTVLLADYAARHGSALVSLEHDERYYEETRSLLRAFGLLHHVDQRLAPLEPLRAPDGRDYPWYSTRLEGSFDFVLLDGPPEKFGRQAALFALAPHLADDGLLWLHDGARAHERDCVALWKRHFHFSETLLRDDPRGILLLRGLRSRRGARPASVPATTDLGVSILTGGRLELLRRTLDTLRARNPTLLEQSRVVVMVNGEDPETRTYVEGLPFVDRLVFNTGDVYPIGVATSRVIEILAEDDRVRTILHLEDDWAAETTDSDWLERARRILDRDSGIGQVRLRHCSERVLRFHMVTRRPIRWRSCDGFRVAASAHFTFNPSLIRAADVPKVFPCRDERDAQVKFLQSGWATAQLLPGVFRHIGEHQSRRALFERLVTAESTA